MEKKKIEGLVDDFIYERLGNKSCEIINVEAKSLLTWNRFDLAFRLFYLENVNLNKQLSLKIYKECIRVQTLDKFTELGNDKNGFERFVSDFNLTYQDIKDNKFDSTKSLVPISSDATILNGAHRVASSIFLTRKISCIKTEQPSMIANWRYFYEHGVSSDVLDLVSISFIKKSKDNIYLAFLWPSGKKNSNKAEALFSNIVYKKEIHLNTNGAFSLLVELYKHMDWVGSKESGFPGVKQKLIECFPNFDGFTLLVFQESSLENVRALKEKVREINNIGYSSIHITDTKEEAVRISELLLNSNGLHFLNYSKVQYDLGLDNDLYLFKKYVSSNNVDLADVVVDGSTILSLYGLRKNDDIDFLSNHEDKIANIANMFDSHDDELIYHEIDKFDLIYNPKYYFVYCGLKFISFNQIYKMKKRRGTPKDKIDCSLMNGLLGGNHLKLQIIKIKQKIFYWKIKSIRNLRGTSVLILKYFKLYAVARNFYRFFVKGR